MKDDERSPLWGENLDVSIGGRLSIGARRPVRAAPRSRHALLARRFMAADPADVAALEARLWSATHHSIVRGASA